MAHPYKKQSDAFKAKKYDSGGKVDFYETKSGPRGSIESKGASTYRRELGRNPAEPGSNLRGSFGGKAGIKRLIHDRDWSGDDDMPMKRGGGIKSVTAGKDSGVGRLQLSKVQKAERGRK